MKPYHSGTLEACGKFIKRRDSKELRRCERLLVVLRILYNFGIKAWRLKETGEGQLSARAAETLIRVYPLTLEYTSSVVK